MGITGKFQVMVLVRVQSPKEALLGTASPGCVEPVAALCSELRRNWRGC